MKKRMLPIIILLLFIFPLLIAGCSSTSSTVNSGNDEQQTSGVDNSSTVTETSEEENSVEEPALLDPQDITMGYAGDDQWKPQIKEDFFKACEELGIHCVLGDINQLIEQGVDAIVQNTNNNSSEGYHNDILNARDKGIPVFILDADTITDGAFSIAVDQKEFAAISLEWIAEAMGGEGDFIYVHPGPNNVRSTAIEEMLANYPGIHVVDSRIEKYDAPANLRADVVDFVNTYPDLKAIWSDAEFMQVAWGLEDSGMALEDWPLFVCPASKEGIDMWRHKAEKDPNFDCIAVVNPPGIAYNAVYAAYYLLSGYEIDPSVLGGEYGKMLPVSIPVVTGENLEEWWATVETEDVAYDVLLDELMTPEMIREQWFLEK